MKRPKLKKPFWEMSARELAAATRQFDQPISTSKTRALTKAERAQFARMRKAPQRSIFISRNADGVWVRLDPELLRRTSRYAADRKLSLTEVINRSLKGLLAVVE